MLAALAGFLALAPISAVPTSTSVSRDDGVREIHEGTSYSPLGVALSVIMVIAAVLCVVGIVLYLRGNNRAAKRAFLGAGLFGLPVIVPGILALIARRLVAP